MNKKTIRCYFGCIPDGILHTFPNPTWKHPYTDKFMKWKSVLSLKTQERGNDYILHSVRLCNRHFEDKYRCGWIRLTRNAIPTLNLERWKRRVKIEPKDMKKPLLVVLKSLKDEKQPLGTKQLVGKVLSSVQESTGEPSKTVILVNQIQPVKVNEQNLQQDKSLTGIIIGPLHTFPTWEYPHTERFLKWKSVLKLDTQEKGNDYIFNSVRLCYRHFENMYRCQHSRLLTRNAVPTLNLVNWNQKENEIEIIIPSTGLPSVQEMQQPIHKEESTVDASQAEVEEEVIYSWEPDGAVEPSDHEEETIQKDKGPFSWQQESAEVPFDEEDADASLWEVPVHSEADKRSPSPGQVPQAPTYDHSVYRCDECLQDIQGFRYTCVQCVDVDLCGACEARQAHATHYVLRIPGPRPHGEVMSVLQTVRRALLSDAIVHVAPDSDTQRVDVEIKEEPKQEDPIHVECTNDGTESNMIKDVDKDMESHNLELAEISGEDIQYLDEDIQYLDEDIQYLDDRDTGRALHKKKWVSILQSPKTSIRSLEELTIMQPVGSTSMLQPMTNIIEIKETTPKTITDKEKQKEESLSRLQDEVTLKPSSSGQKPKISVRNTCALLKRDILQTIVANKRSCDTPTPLAFTSKKVKILGSSKNIEQPMISQVPADTVEASNRFPVVPQNRWDKTIAKLKQQIQSDCARVYLQRLPTDIQAATHATQQCYKIRDDNKSDTR